MKVFDEITESYIEYFGEFPDEDHNKILTQSRNLKIISSTEYNSEDKEKIKKIIRKSNYPLEIDEFDFEVNPSAEKLTFHSDCKFTRICFKELESQIRGKIRYMNKQARPNRINRVYSKEEEEEIEEEKRQFLNQEEKERSQKEKVI